MRRIWAIATTTALVPLLVAGCGSEQSANNTTSSDSSQGTSREGGGGQAVQRDRHTTSDVCFDRGRSLGAETQLYIEHNATDQDTGVHSMFGQEGLAEGCLQKPDGTPIMFIDPRNRLDNLGINQLFFESREPPADEYSIADLKADFPEGEYRISGLDFQGNRRFGTVMFTHAIPAPPEIVSPRVVPEEEGERNKVPSETLTVRWKPVNETIEGEPVDLAGYEVIVTQAKFDNPNAPLARPEYDVHVPPDVRELSVPRGFLQPGTLYELEVLALEDGGNQTISLGFFTTR